MTLQLGTVRRRLDTPIPHEGLFVLFCRVLAIYALMAGVIYSARLIGLEALGGVSFDQLGLHRQVVTLVLAVLFPFAGLGLWIVSSWGGVLWAAVATCEVVIYTAYSAEFGSHPYLAVFNLVVTVAYLAFAFWIFLQKKKRSEEKR